MCCAGLSLSLSLSAVSSTKNGLPCEAIKRTFVYTHMCTYAYRHFHTSKATKSIRADDCKCVLYMSIQNLLHLNIRTQRNAVSCFVRDRRTNVPQFYETERFVVYFDSKFASNKTNLDSRSGVIKGLKHSKKIIGTYVIFFLLRVLATCGFASS